MGMTVKICQSNHTFLGLTQVYVIAEVHDDNIITSYYHYSISRWNATTYIIHVLYLHVLL